MKVLCAIGMRGGAAIIRRVMEVIGPQHELYLLHVIDSGPRRTLEELLRKPGLLRRTPPPPHEPAPPYAPPPFYSQQPIDEAEQAAGKAALEEASREAERISLHFETNIQKGQPEQTIVQMAVNWECQLVVIQASEGTQGRPQIGPESVGHTARFVLDHAPCDVLLLREMDNPRS
jgi:nucleotide-binding universal stress UspA family protein